MEFLDISSLGVAYRYAVKIEHKFKHQKKWEFGSTNPQQPKYGKDDPNKQPPENQSKPQEKKGNRRRRRTLESGAISTKSPGTTLMNVTQNSHWWPRSKKKSPTLIQNLIQKIMEGERSSTQTPLPLSQPQQSNQKNQQILKRGEPLPFIDVGKGDPIAFHC
jgi:hypothetical protein